MPARSYKIEFFQLDVVPTAEISSVRELFEAVDDEELDADLEVGGFTRELWKLVFDRYPDSVCGQFRKFRDTDIPEVGSVGGDAEQIDLEDGEGLIEKNFFIFYEERNILAWHKNNHSSGVTQFVNFLSKISGAKASALPILQPDAIERLMNEDVELKKIEFTLPRPTNPTLYRDDNFSSSILSLMNDSEADTIKLSMAVDLRRDAEQRLSSRLKNTLRNITRYGASSAKAIVFDENGYEYPIDLIADRVYSYQFIETDRHFPPNLTMYGIIDTAKSDCQEALDGYFGALEDSMD
ncbi:DUF6731 family protein [Pantoea agglomerans]|uniref:DUF6731 family protein n=1 Tax=Enterobacter agglomerans TaxID=549 RepID=UPI00165472A0|nr:DUF6731 family protein [Pantoea agglomerans]